MFPKPTEDYDDEMDSSGESFLKSTAAKQQNQQVNDAKDSSSGSSPDAASQDTKTSSSEGSVDLATLRAKQMAFATSDENEQMYASDSGTRSYTRSVEKHFLSKRRKLLILGEKEYGPGIVAQSRYLFSRIRDEWVLCSARVGLLSSDQYQGVPPTDPVELFPLLVDNFHFDEAFDIARYLAI